MSSSSSSSLLSLSDSSSSSCLPIESDAKSSVEGLPVSLAAIQSEYRSLPTVTPDALELQGASASLNISKNRYCNVLPLDSTRVRLSEVEGLPHSDYINASVIRSECEGAGHYSYIASQAPPSDTIGDFWRMVWEQRVAVLVMLTKLMERGRRKADVYWPEEEGSAVDYGDFRVVLKKQHVSPTMAIRALELRQLNNRGNNSNSYDDYERGTDNNDIDDDEAAPPPREILHLHYLAWPDHGTPRSCASILELLVIMKDFVARARINQQLAGPIVVQCSAGIGRTGTFIAIHQSLERLSAHGVCDVPRSVELLRRQRCGAVQTEEQYVFIYRTIHHALAFCASLVDSADDG